MSAHLDAAARLADGSPAVDTAQLYVTACQLLGYQHPQLTRHVGQLQEWYASEDGLDLQALAADSAALRAVAATTAEVLALQDSQAAAIDAAWQGRSGLACQEMLRRHGAASARVAAAVRDSADVLAALREELWRQVDRKVTATLAVDDVGATDWPAAARTVTTGAGDRATASELVDAEVKPFVDTAIGLDWLTTMHETLASITAAFEAAVAELSSLAAGGFGAPGDPEPTFTAPSSGGSPPGWAAPITGAGPVVPAAAAAPDISPSSTPPAAATAPAAAEPAAAAAPLPAAPTGGVSGGAGGALPDLGGGFAAVGRQLADLLGGLVGSAGETLGGDFGADEINDSAEVLAEDLEDPDAASDEDDEDADEEDADGEGADREDAADEDEAANGTEAEDGEAENADAVETTAPATEIPTPTEPTPTAPPAPPPVPPAPVPAVAPVTPETPCEIAADELPQVGQ